MGIPRAFFEPEAASENGVRRFVATCLTGRPDLDRDIAVRLAGELAANAIHRSRLTFEVGVSLRTDCAYIWVDDLSALLPVSAVDLRPNAALVESRFATVEALADRVGIEPTIGGVRAWFEVCT